MIENDTFPKGLDENVVRAISAKKNEPQWMLDFRLKAFKRWLDMSEPAWSDNQYPTINYQVCSLAIDSTLRLCQDNLLLVFSVP